MTTRSKIVRIGNSQGLRLAKSILELSGISGEVEIEALDGKIIIHSVSETRQSWDAAFAEMASTEDDTLLYPSTEVSEWDESEWDWK